MDRPALRSWRGGWSSRSNPPVALSVTVGKKAARAMPICSFASWVRLSAAAISGRRSSSCDGSPTGITGGSTRSGSGARVNSAGGLPSRTAIACSYAARSTSMSVSCAIVVSSWVCACATSDFGDAPPSNRFSVSASAARRIAGVKLKFLGTRGKIDLRTRLHPAGGGVE